MGEDLFRHLVISRQAFPLGMLKKAAELTHNMYQITYTLPESKHAKNKMLKMDEKQQELRNIVNKNFQGVPTLKTAE